MPLSVNKFPKNHLTSYASLRKSIQSGDLLLCSGSGWFSKMIQRATGSVWSHVGFVMRLDQIDRVMVLESVEPLGVRTVPLSKYLSDYDSEGNPYPGGLVIARHNKFASSIDRSGLKKFGQFAVDLFGYPYDKNEIAKIAARIVSASLSFSASERTALQRDKEYICSEYAWECYRTLGIEVKSDPRGFIAPSDFAKDKDVALLGVLKDP